MENSILQHLTDSFILSELLEAFDISESDTFDKYQMKVICAFLDYIEETEGVRLPLVPMVDLYRQFTVDTFDCISCGFSLKDQESFVEYLKKVVEDHLTSIKN